MIATSLALLVSFIPSSAHSDESKDLPDDLSPVVLSLDYQNGYSPPRKAESPYLTVRADGRVTAAMPFTSAKLTTTYLDPKDLEGLLEFVTVKHDLLSYDANAVAASIEESGSRVLVEDAADTVIRVSTKEKVLELRMNALDLVAKNHPGIPALQSFRAVSQRLIRVRHIVLIGGDSAAKTIVHGANEELAARFSDAPELTLDDIANVSESRGVKRVSLYRSLERGGYLVEVSAREDGKATYSASKL